MFMSIKNYQKKEKRTIYAMNKRQKEVIRRKVQQTYDRERITDLRRLFNAVRDDWFDGHIVNKDFIMGVCARVIK